MKRELTEEEKDVCLKQIERLLDEIEFLKYNVAYGTLMLEQGLDVNLKQKKMEFTIQRQEHSKNLKLTENKINDLRDQVENGVEIKEKPAEAA